MVNDVVNAKGNIALLSKVFDFLNQLEEEQIYALLENKAKLCIEVQVDKHLDALIEEKVNAVVDEKLSSFMNEKLSSSNVKKADGLAEDVKDSINAKRGRPKKDAKVVKGKVAQTSKNKDAKTGGTSVGINSEFIETAASEIKTLSSMEQITEYFENNPLNISVMKSLANKHFGISDTRKMNVKSLINGIAEAVVNQEADETDN